MEIVAADPALMFEGIELDGAKRRKPYRRWRRVRCRWSARCFTAGVELDPATEREREARMEALKSELGLMLAQGKGDAVLDRGLSLVVKLERENERFARRLLRELRYRFGRQTEKLSREELAQLFLALGGDEATAESDEELKVPAPAPPEA